MTTREEALASLTPAQHRELDAWTAGLRGKSREELVGIIGQLLVDEIEWQIAYRARWS